MLITSPQTYLIKIHKGETMTTQTINSFNNNLLETIKNIIEGDEALTIKTKSGNVVMISQDKYNSMIETLYLKSAPGVNKVIQEALKSRKTNYVDYNPQKKW